MAGERCWTDKSLGMDRPIDRRDFLNGVAVAIGRSAQGRWRRAPGSAAARAGRRTSPAIIRRVLNGMRGSHPGSFENAHALRDGDFWKPRADCRHRRAL